MQASNSGLGSLSRPQWWMWRLAGVSKSTVSNVIRNAGCVKPAMRARVAEAITALGHRHNVFARQLVQQRTRIPVFIRLAHINFTTVAQPQEALAELAIDTLARRMAGQLESSSVRQRIELKRVIRGSIAPPPD